MSCNVGELIACPNLQSELNNQFGGLTAFPASGTPLTEFLTSAENTEGVIQRQIDTGNGHTRTVELVFQSRDLESSVSSSISNTCTGGNKPCTDSQTYSIGASTGSEIKWSIALPDLIYQCEGDDTFFAKQVMIKLDAIRRKMETTNFTQLAALKGIFASSGNSTAISVKTKNTTTLQYVPDAVERVRYEAEMNEYYGGIYLFGGGQSFQTYFSQMGFSVANTYLGVDIAAGIQAKGIAPFFNYRATAALGTDHFYSVAKGAVQLITFNQNRGSRFREINQPSLIMGIITDPMTGVTYDYSAVLDCKTWNFSLGVAHKLIGLPADLFYAGDRLSGVTWVNDFVISN